MNYKLLANQPLKNFCGKNLVSSALKNKISPGGEIRGGLIKSWVVENFPLPSYF